MKSTKQVIYENCEIHVDKGDKMKWFDRLKPKYLAGETRVDRVLGMIKDSPYTLVILIALGVLVVLIFVM